MRWMMTFGAALALICPLAAHAAEPAAVKPGETFGKIVRLDPALDDLIPAGAKIEKLAAGFEWSEGPAWNQAEGSLVFSDVPTNTAYRWKDGQGLSVFLRPSGYTGDVPRGGEPGSNGLCFDAEGNLILCQHGNRQVARLDQGVTYVPLVTQYKGKRFNSPNDLVYHTNGDLYFTDPPYGLLQRNDDPKKEMDYNGVYRLAASGELTLLTKEMTYPNGIALSPDEKTLYVAQSDPSAALWKAFPIREDGTLGESRVLFDATDRYKSGAKGLPDGLKVDQKGNLFATGPGGVLVFNPKGKLLGIIDTGEATANVGFGDDGSTLYITADMYLGRLKTTTKGLGF